MSELNKIFIIYANAGAGHRRAAEALFKVIGDYFPDKDIRLIDVLDHSSTVFKNSYLSSYLFMVNRCPWFWGFAYYILDIKLFDRIARFFRRIINTIHCHKFEKFMVLEQPDLVFSTHFLPNEIITSLKQRGLVKPYLVTCITDYYPHSFWRDQGVDLYITPNEDLTPRLLQWGVSTQKIVPLGIPIDPAFEVIAEKKEIRQKLGLNTNQFTILITSGGFGVGPVEELVREIIQIKQPLQVLVICGNNPKLQDDVFKLSDHKHHTFKIFGFVDNMDQLMDASDIMISKSGGLTSTEAMAKKLPLIILYPIPGQEQSNCNFLLKHGAGVRVKDPKQARLVLERLSDEPTKLQQLRVNMSNLGRPRAAREIISYIKKIS